MANNTELIKLSNIGSMPYDNDESHVKPSPPNKTSIIQDDSHSKSLACEDQQQDSIEDQQQDSVEVHQDSVEVHQDSIEVHQDSIQDQQPLPTNASIIQEDQPRRSIPKRNIILRLPSDAPKNERIDRIRLLSRIQAMLNDDRLGHILTPFIEDDFEHMNPEQLKLAIDHMLYTINTSRSHQDMESSISYGLSGIEMIAQQLNINASGLTQAVMSNESNLDDIRELSLRTMSFEYKPVEHRLGITVAGLLSKLHLNNEAKQAADAIRIREKMSTSTQEINSDILERIQKLRNESL